jgi:hypothetical protein
VDTSAEVQRVSCPWLLLAAATGAPPTDGGACFLRGSPACAPFAEGILAVARLSSVLLATAGEASGDARVRAAGCKATLSPMAQSIAAQRAIRLS